MVKFVNRVFWAVECYKKLNKFQFSTQLTITPLIRAFAVVVQFVYFIFYAWSSLLLLQHSNQQGILLKPIKRRSSSV